jgi:SRSO17 transposase
VWTLDDHGVADEVRVETERWRAGFEEVMSRIAPRFARVEPRRRVRGFLTGLLAGLPRANCWTLAEHAGDATPDGMQHLLGRAVWDHDVVMADLRDYVMDHLAGGGDDARADPGDGVLVVDETGS